VTQKEGHEITSFCCSSSGVLYSIVTSILIAMLIIGSLIIGVVYAKYSYAGQRGIHGTDTSGNKKTSPIAPEMLEVQRSDRFLKCLANRGSSIPQCRKASEHVKHKEDSKDDSKSFYKYIKDGGFSSPPLAIWIIYAAMIGVLSYPINLAYRDIKKCKIQAKSRKYGEWCAESILLLGLLGTIFSLALALANGVDARIDIVERFFDAALTSIVGIIGHIVLRHTNVRIEKSILTGTQQ
jgi:hypothetical protein